jgi:hypothetical protein
MTRCDHDWRPRDDGIPQCDRCGRRPHASPSQIETWGRWQLEKSEGLDGGYTREYRGCRRKWKYRRIQPRDDSARPENAAFGDRAHKLKEAWTRHGTWTEEIAASPEGKCLAAGLHHFAPPQQAIAEREVYRPMLGVMWHFKVDETSQWVPGASVLVSDLKTTGNLAYAKTPEQLLDDPQRIVYAADVGESLGVPVVRSRWVYCRRKPPKSVAVEVEERTADTLVRLRVLTEQTVRPMIAANALPLEAFPRDGLVTGECERWSRDGCEFKRECLAALDPVDLLNARLSR